ncbi:mechanosensitive ion channel family protein [Roseomonas frigidaquae]|uniref:Small-conductance mechanosensitive channel n=1 Tax=Falsiroseomonas frigidaquae TaxID=487318 RepID=A0ABX1EXN6_9PROT|nr:mechanosensitive ion channel family protein [Falsiroseomonas frigidaquae]NKE44867.1 mechanosensitive ion channel family protein [Falsiroseomonas frigidaquae]
MQAAAQTTIAGDRPSLTSGETASRTIEVGSAIIQDKVGAWSAGFQYLLPNIVVALLVVAIFIGLAWLVAKGFRRWARRRDRENLGEVLGAFLKWVVIFLGVLIGLTIVMPSLRPGDLVAGLGVGSVAIGFAFKDILQNWLAGVLLLLRQPFRPGDQIIVSGFEGTVQRIETRATVIRTYDGRDAIIPNADVYSNPVLVNTAHERRRDEYDLGIGYGDDIEAARQAILAAIGSLPEIEADPAPEVLVWDLAGSSVNLRIRWWTHARRIDVVLARSAVLQAAKQALDRDGIDMPFPTQVMLFHDQTEELDGLRGEQREGWPKRAAGRQPRPARDLAPSPAPDPAPNRAGSNAG